MNRFRVVLVKFALAWAGISALFVIAVSVQLVRMDNEVPAEAEKGYKKDYGQFTVEINHESKEYDDDYYLSVFKAGQRLVGRYKIPVKEHKLYEFSPEDVIVIPITPKSFRLILYSAVHDCDQESLQYIWLFKYTDSMRLTKIIPISSMRILGTSPVRIMGYSGVFLPAFEGFKYDSFTVPVDISIGDRVTIVPMLNQQSLTLLKSVFEKELKDRGSILAKSTDTAIIEAYSEAKHDFRLALSANEFSY